MKLPRNHSIFTTLFAAHTNLSRQNQRPHFHTTQAQSIHQQLEPTKHFIPIHSSHCTLLKSGAIHNTFVTNRFINGYVRAGEIESAHKLLDEMLEPNVVSWTAVLSGYTHAGNPGMGLRMYREMMEEMVVPNEFTFSAMVNACSVLADLKSGRLVHGHVEAYGYRTNLVVCCSLIDMYGKCNGLEDARQVFDLLEERNIVAWTSIITGYAQNGQGYDALELFKEFNKTPLNRPNQHLLASVVNACSSLGRLAYGKATHAVVVKQEHERNDVISCALVDMYAKCGCIAYSDKIFRRIQHPSVIPYTSMIIGAAKHGLGQISLDLFVEMLMKNITPNRITFLGVLYACSHSGQVDMGLEHLNTMHQKYGVRPDAMHYTCVVDMLGRTGRLDEAHRLAKSIQADDNQGALLWGALLSASRVHGRVDIAVEASKWLMERKQQMSAAYATMSNAYAVAGTWEDVNNTRSEMRRAGVRKEPGCSWVEIKDSVFAFYAGDVASCPRGNEVVDLLKELGRRMKERGYVGGSSGLVFVEVEEEANEEIVSLHSERLALGFCLISIPEGVAIRIMKNLRMCGDCHDAFKLISDIVDRDFIVRDVNRFHHFKNGVCSCHDFW
ncbi:hypothetical protein Drorol1_Dr00014067 [Drosera rotundifolia]